MRFIDLSHSIRPGMPMYPGLPGPGVEAYLTHEASRGRYAPGTEFCITELRVTGNTGTYLDAPFHRVADGRDVAALSGGALANLAVTRIPVPVGTRGIGPSLLPDSAFGGRAVLLQTGWDARWGSEDYFGGGHPFLTLEGAVHLAEGGAALVGIDACNLDDLENAARPAHSVLLGEGIPILENLTRLASLPESGARLFAVPVAVEGMASIPVRAFALAP